MIRKNDVKATVRAAVLLKNVRENGEMLVPVTVSGRHIHLCQAHVHALFGVGYTLRQRVDLFQPGQYACEETVVVKGPKGTLQTVRVLGPVREATQIEISVTDAYTLGVPACVRLSGDTAQTPGACIIGPAGQVEIEQGVIVAKRHIHFSTAQAAAYGVRDGSLIALEQKGERPSVLKGFVVRVNDAFELEAHVDTDEANAALIKNDALLRVCQE